MWPSMGTGGLHLVECAAFIFIQILEASCSSLEAICLKKCFQEQIDTLTHKILGS